MKALAYISVKWALQQMDTRAIIVLKEHIEAGKPVCLNGSYQAIGTKHL
jgi:hypothetical protein